MLSLKPYQETCLDELTKYLKACDRLGPKLAFYQQTDRQYFDVPVLHNLPYVCLRVPTGGGKTLLAAHAVGVVTRELLKVGRGIVLWLAPTNTIVEQTLKALRDRKHPYRQALEQSAGQVSVMDLKEALYLGRGTVNSDTVVIVTTLAALRVTDTDGRKIYETNGTLMPHFSGLDEQQKVRLEKAADGVIVFSLANVLKLHRPVVIMDEAHNARTVLTFDSFARFGPSCILEFTATPDESEQSRSNVLYAVSAAELKVDAMVKLPLRVASRPQWKEALSYAVNKRAELEAIAVQEEQATGEYIRPIALLQAQPQREREPNAVTVDVVKSFLMNDCNLPADQIAVAYRDTDELEGIDILARDCPIRYVVTVSKLKEGWDCPFAYVLGTVSNTGSETAITQILGRVLRLPKARHKEHVELNHAYVFAPATSGQFLDVLTTLKDCLVDCGFEDYEAAEMLQPIRRGGDGGGLFGDGAGEIVPIVETVTAKPKLEALPAEIRDRMTFKPARGEGGTPTLVYAGPPITATQQQAMERAGTNEQDRAALVRIAKRSRDEPTNPAAMGEAFDVPGLAIRLDEDEPTLFESEDLPYQWNLSEFEATVTPQEYPTDSQGRVAEVDIDEAGQVALRELRDVQHQLTMYDTNAPGTEAELAVWLDQHVPHPDIPLHQSQPFMLKLVRSLTVGRGLPFHAVVAGRFRLRDVAELKIDTHRRIAAKRSFQQLVFDGQESVEVSPSVVFSFPLTQYPANRIYDGPIRYARHYYEKPGHMNGEEAACALLIDRLATTWVRNLERDRYAFWLPLPSRRFYPDFVAKLPDGRILVVEYKGAMLESTDDSDEKRAIGELWQARSAGRCVFRFVTLDTMEQLLQQLS